MKIVEVIQKLKNYYSGIDFEGQPIDDITTRDQVLYGDDEQECTGIVTTCWAHTDVIKKAQELGANLIICHEALFWNHGDHTDWLIEEQNQTFLSKQKLLDESGIVVWRNHDYIHSGMPVADGYVDGIFYGVAKKLGWENNITDDRQFATTFEIPETTVEALLMEMIEKFNLKGAKAIGRLDTKVKKVFICAHVMGNDNDLIQKTEDENIDLLFALELIDFTVTEYIKDRSLLYGDKAIITLGHFNAEEPGMEYLTEYLEDAIGIKIQCIFVQSGDMYHYVLPK